MRGMVVVVMAAAATAAMAVAVEQIISSALLAAVVVMAAMADMQAIRRQAVAETTAAMAITAAVDCFATAPMAAAAFFRVKKPAQAQRVPLAATAAAVDAMLRITGWCNKMIYNIFADGKKINCIVASERFVKEYCSGSGYTFEEVIAEKEAAPTPEERITTLEAQRKAQNDQLDFYEECIAEMASIVYA